MKLISFAALSFLAITVSAYPGDNTLPQSTAIQSAEQSQSTATQSEEQPQSTTTQSQEQSQSTDIQSAEKSQDEVRAEIERLERIHKEKERLLTRAKKDLSTSQRKVLPLGNKIDNIGIKLQDPSISSEEKVRLNQKHDDAEAAFAELIVKCSEQNQRYTDAMDAFNKANTQVRLLEENQALLAEYNADHVAQMGTSLNSFYNLVLLEEQYDEIATNIEMLSYENARINSAGPAFLVDTLPARLKKNEDQLRTLQRLAKAAKGILEQGGVHVAN